jgi:hypothetical protein
MPGKTINTPSAAPTTESPTTAIRQFQLQLAHFSNRRSAHLTNVGLAALKHVIVACKSDRLRLEAIRFLFEIDAVKQKLSAINRQTPRQPRQQTPAEANDSEFMQQLGVMLTTADLETIRELGEHLRLGGLPINGKPDTSEQGSR